MSITDIKTTETALDTSDVKDLTRQLQEETVRYSQLEVSVSGLKTVSTPDLLGLAWPFLKHVFLFF